MRDALARGELARTVLVWRTTNFVCRRDVYGEWDAALKSFDGKPRTPRTDAAAACAAATARAWRNGSNAHEWNGDAKFHRSGAPARVAREAGDWGAVGLHAACKHAADA